MAMNWARQADAAVGEALRHDPVPRLPLRRRLRAIAGLIGRGDRPKLFAMAGVMLLDSLAGAALALALKWMIDGVVEGDSTRAITAAVIGAAASGVLAVSGFVSANLQDWLATLVGVEVNRETLDRTLAVPGVEHLERPEYLDQVHIVRDGSTELVRSALATTNLVSLAVKIGVGVWLLATVHPLLVLVPVFAFPSLWLAPRGQRVMEEAAVAAGQDQRAAKELHRLFTEPAAAMELRVFDCQAELDRRADEAWRRAARTKLRASLHASLTESIGWALLALGYVAALLLVVDLVAAGRASPGAILLVSSLALQLRWNVAMSAVSLRQAQTAMRLVDRFVWVHEHADAAIAAERGRTAVPARLADGIVFDGVGFTYPGTATPVLDGVDLVLPAGSVVALVGENGAGKTTIVKLLCGYYRPSAGRITVDGTDLCELDLTAWRAQLAGSLQDHVRLESRVLHSVGAGAPDRMDDAAAVVDALGRADARSLLAQWPDGLDSHLGKSYAPGLELSGGQWQKVAIARGMMRDRPLVRVLDEPTAALDPTAEHALYERFAGAAGEARTSGGITLLVSHRFSSVRMADLIVVLEHGRVTEQGTHDELMALDGTYAAMYRQQAAAYS